MVRKLLHCYSLGVVILNVAVCASCDPPDAHMPMPEMLCRLTEKVYADGWITVGEVAIYSDASYRWQKNNIWTNPPISETVTGKLPRGIFDDAVAAIHSSARGEKTNAIPVYEVSLDDTKTAHPKGVLLLLDYLRRQHPTVSSKGTTP